MRFVKPLAFVLTLCLIAGCAHHHHHHHQDDTAMQLEALPEAVQDHFNRDHPDVHIRSIDQEVAGSETNFKITYEDQGEIKQTEYTREGDEIKPDVKLP
jgi:hypothetical protein